MTRIVVLGANGQLGTDLCPILERCGFGVARVTHADLDVRDFGGCAERLSALRPDVVVNTTAFHDVERCETEVETAFAVNAYAARSLAQTCDRLNAMLVHLSSDYVFGGDRQSPYAEGAALRPLNVYGVSKAAGEYFIRQVARRHIIIRTSGLFGLAGASGKRGNFVETMLRLGSERESVSVVMDQVLSPTYTVDLSAAIARLIAAGAQGVFHITNAWAVSWYEFAREIFARAALPAKLVPVTTADYGAHAARPAYSVLDNTRLRLCGFGKLRNGREALSAYLDARTGRAGTRTPTLGDEKYDNSSSKGRAS